MRNAELCSAIPKNTSKTVGADSISARFKRNSFQTKTDLFFKKFLKNRSVLFYAKRLAVSWWATRSQQFFTIKPFVIAVGYGILPYGLRNIFRNNAANYALRITLWFIPLPLFVWKAFSLRLCSRQRGRLWLLSMKRGRINRRSLWYDIREFGKPLLSREVLLRMRR